MIIEETEEIKKKEQKIWLYEDFLFSVWEKIKVKNNYEVIAFDNGSYDVVLEEYLKTFLVLSKASTYRIDAIDLINYIDTKCNGVMPEHIQILFNEWLLERM